MTIRHFAVLVLLAVTTPAYAAQGGALYNNPLKCLAGDYAFPGTVIREFPAKRRNRCLMECSSSGPACQSVNAIQGPSENVSCELMSDAPSAFSQMETRANATHFVKSAQKMYLPALHGFTCKCDDGYQGVNCDGGDRLNNVIVSVGNTAPGHGFDPTLGLVCGSRASTPNGATVTIPCGGATVGRYVTVYLPGGGRVLTLCEVVVGVVE